MRELSVSALSSGEWNYLRGLFLADGYSVKLRGRFRGYIVYFFLQGNEEGLARRVLELLRRAGLNPWIQKPKDKNMVAVVTSSKSLFNFLPDKKTLLHDLPSRQRFYEENRLLSAERGVPFVAGLLDGDGYCGVIVTKGRGCFGRWVWKYKWSFTQRRYLFLAEYVNRFVESLVRDGTHIHGFPNGATEVGIRKSGVKALLDAGIAKYSWKVVRWQISAAEAENERLKHYNIGEVARTLGLGYGVVRRWVKSGEMKHVRKEGTIGVKDTPSVYYVPVEEVEQFKEKLQTKREENDRVNRGGIRFKDAEKILGVSWWTLRRAFKRGEFKATLVREWHGRGYWVIPREEVERLKLIREHDRSPEMA